jgi:hypothetical protein
VPLLEPIATSSLGASSLLSSEELTLHCPQEGSGLVFDERSRLSAGGRSRLQEPLQDGHGTRQQFQKVGSFLLLS